MVIYFLIAILSLLVAGCGTDAEPEPEPEPDTRPPPRAITDPKDPTQDPPAIGNPGEELTLVAAQVSGKEIKLILGSAPCYMPPRAMTTEQGEEQVAVTVYGQVVPPETACIQSFQYGCVQFELDQALGDRKLVDSREEEIKDTALPKSMQKELSKNCKSIPVQELEQ
jgi:hypothetical protein